MHPRTNPLKVGVIGLGTGTLAVYGSQGRRLPLLRHQSGGRRPSRSATSPTSATATRRSRLALGDARLSLEREPPQQFDVLVIDAFSSDAIPVHLITHEAVGVYLQAHEAGRRHRVPRHQPVPQPGAGGRRHRRRARPARALDRATTARTRSRAAATGCCCHDGPGAARPIRGSPRPRTRSCSGRDWRLWTDDFNNLRAGAEMMRLCHVIRGLVRTHSGSVRTGRKLIARALASGLVPRHSGTRAQRLTRQRNTRAVSWPRRIRTPTFERTSRCRASRSAHRRGWQFS